MCSLSFHRCTVSFCFFFNATATTEIYTLSLHDALPIFQNAEVDGVAGNAAIADSELPHRALLLAADPQHRVPRPLIQGRSEEHSSELQSQFHLVCRLLLEKKKTVVNS